MVLFVDISVVSKDYVIVMSNKFMITRINNGQEVESFNVHKEINFKETSTTLFSNERMSFIGTSTGSIICVDNKRNEQNVLLKCWQSSTITAVEDFNYS